MSANQRTTVDVTLAPCGCGNEPVWGGITFFNAQGEFIRHNAIRCLSCHYWFYTNGEKEKTAERWNEVARQQAATLTTAQAETAALRAEVERLREDAERWRAFFGSERFYVMGGAGFDWDKAAVREPRDETNWLHFTLNVWDRHPAGNDERGCRGAQCCFPMSIIFVPPPSRSASHERGCCEGGGANHHSPAIRLAASPPRHWLCRRAFAGLAYVRR